MIVPGLRGLTGKPNVPLAFRVKRRGASHDRAGSLCEIPHASGFFSSTLSLERRRPREPGGSAVMCGAAAWAAGHAAAVARGCRHPVFEVSLALLAATAGTDCRSASGLERLHRSQYVLRDR
jgi:hypothetical protein